VFGAQLDDAGTTDAGIAYAFDAMTGALLGTLSNPAPTTGDSFGYASGLSGDTAVISAYQDDPGGGGNNEGSVYVFKAQFPAITNCTGPAGTPGTLSYSSQYKVLQYCNGASWVGVGMAASAEPCSGSPAIGTVCGDGTIYAGISIDGNVKMYTTPANAVGSPMDWGPGGDISIVNCLAAWGPQTGCRTGRANTEIMATIGGGYTAAEYCASLSAHGHADWYLPAQHELDVLFLNKDAIGNFPTDVYYWSSSEQGSSFAWHESFGGGAMGNNSKVNVYHVRCVRK
jgi:hypothetical protein